MIQFLNLKDVNSQYAEQIKTVLNRVADSGWYLLGKELEAFEAKFADYCNMIHCLGVANGLDALKLALMAFDIKQGDEVIVPSNTYIATVLAITQIGAEPIFVEPNERDHLIDVNRIERAITKNTKAIMPVHLYGRTCDLTGIYQIAKKYNLAIIEDAAQSHGVLYDKTDAVDNYSNRAVCYSFYPSKNLGALADAGAVLTNNSDIADKIKALRNYGSHKRYYNKYIGLNSRMEEMQAGILSIKLDGLNNDNNHRRKIAEYYITNIKNNKIILPDIPNNPLMAVWHLFVVKVENRKLLTDYLTENGIGWQIHYPVPPHKQECYARYNNLSLPIAEKLADTVLSLPISPVIANQDAAKIVEVISAWK